MQPTFRFAHALALMFILCCAIAQASDVQTNFIGTVTGNNPLAGTPAIGSTFTGDIVIDASVTTGEGPNCSGMSFCWSGPSDSFTWSGVKIDSSNAITPSAFAIIFAPTNSSPGTGPDILTIHLDGYDLNTITLTLTDPTGTAFENGGGFDLFTSKTFDFDPLCVTGIGCAFNPRYTGTLELPANTASAPEPTSLSMLAFGLLVPAGTMLRRRRFLV